MYLLLISSTNSCLLCLAVRLWGLYMLLILAQVVLGLNWSVLYVFTYNPPWTQWTSFEISLASASIMRRHFGCIFNVQIQSRLRNVTLYAHNGNYKWPVCGV